MARSPAPERARFVTEPLHNWTSARISEECHREWLDYDAAKRDRYVAYFKRHPDLAHPTQAWSAKDIASALPPGWEGLAALIPKGRHRHHLSGKSSQVLALGLLGTSGRLDPSHAWLWDAFTPLKQARSASPARTFEFEVDKELLGEDSGQCTTVDYLVQDPALVMCIECKWREDGIGACSCANYGGIPATGACRDVIRDERPAYWRAAREQYFLPDVQDGKPCPLSPVYQAVRNVAAALTLRPAGGVGVFGLIYDAANPYFAACGDWPGWPGVLSAALDDANHHDLRFRAVSWQELMPLLVLDDAARDWAREARPGHEWLT